MFAPALRSAAPAVWRVPIFPPTAEFSPFLTGGSSRLTSPSDCAETEHVRKHAARGVAARELFRQLCFEWVTGNGDVHAKNLSVLAGPTGEWRVSPAYDLPSTLPYGDSTMALTIGGRSDGLSRRILLALAADLGIPESAAVRVVDAVLAATAGIADDVAAGVVPLPKHRLRTWERSLRHRRSTAS